MYPMIDEKLAQYAREAKQFMIHAGEQVIRDELIMRAVVAYGMLERRGLLHRSEGSFDQVMDRALAICFIAHNFDDNPPSTEHRAALFAHIIEA